MLAARIQEVYEYRLLDCLVMFLSAFKRTMGWYAECTRTNYCPLLAAFAMSVLWETPEEHAPLHRGTDPHSSTLHGSILGYRGRLNKPCGGQS
jgi:hypothetical protein